MTRDQRWDPCVAHRGAEVAAFIADYFAAAERRVLFVAGAGFDPRSTAVATRLAATSATVERTVHPGKPAEPFPDPCRTR